MCTLMYYMEEFGILYNNSYGGFQFSESFVEQLEERIGHNIDYEYIHKRYRTHPEAIKLFLEKGSEWSSGSYSELRLVYIPMCMRDYYCIADDDGNEMIALDRNRAIVDRTKQYIVNPTPENLNLLKEQIDCIECTSVRYH